jgi:hypothetical protein
MPIYRHRLSGNNPAGDVWNCVFHSQSDAILTTVHPAVLAQVEGDLLAAMTPIWHSATVANEFVTDQLDSGTGHAVAQLRDTIDFPGTSTDAQVPQGMCAVVSWVTTTPGRKGRGRIFLPGPVITSYAANGLLSTATATAIANAANSMLSDMRGTTVPVLLNKLTRATTTIVSARVNVKPSYQRRRLNKVDATYEV